MKTILHPSSWVTYGPEVDATTPFLQTLTYKSFAEEVRSNCRAVIPQNSLDISASYLFAV